MIILSFDIGIRNLAYCLLQIDECGNINISRWRIISLIPDSVKCKSLTVDKAIELLYNKLRSEFSDDDITHVIIENQPTKNQVMKTIQIAIYSYFNYERLLLGRSLEVVKLINASNKIKVCQRLFENSLINPPPLITNITDRYRKNKKMGIFYTQSLLVYLKMSNSSDLIEQFSNSPKQDDLADCLLQAIYYFDSKISKITLQL